MDDLTTRYQRQLWTIERLERICRVMRRASQDEPCLEQYEQEVARIVGEPVSDAAGEWIELIVQSLRSGQPFRAADYLDAC